MLQDLGLTVARAIPPETIAGILSGALTTHGGVVRNAAGQIVAHLQLPAKVGLNMVPGLGTASDILTGYELNSISRNVQQVLELSMINTALSGLGLVTSIVGFAYLARKIERIDDKIESIKQIMQSQQRAQLLGAVDQMRHADQAKNRVTRRQLLLQSKQKFGELAHHYLSQMESLTDIREIEASEEFFTLAFLGGAMCTSDLGMADAARDDMARHTAAWSTSARKHCCKLMHLDDPGRLLDARYVEDLPTADLIGLLDFARDDHRGIEWIDDLRKSRSITTAILTSVARSTDKDAIAFGKKLRAKHDVLRSCAAHYAFLAEKNISVTFFATELEKLRAKDDAGLLWVTNGSAT